jgi:rubrerythrin
MKKKILFIVLALSVTMSTLALPNPPGMKKTIDNLQAAFNGESNANAKYLAFAKKADADGYGPVASLFRAAARAEQVHFEHHAAVIKALGGTPKAEIETPVVKSTRENVQASLEGETYEYTTMYPGFMVLAEAEQIKDAVTTFQRAGEAESVHARLYASVLKDMNAWTGAAKTFYVCPTCGNVLDARPASVCPICGEDGKDFMTIK